MNLSLTPILWEDKNQLVISNNGNNAGYTNGLSCSEYELVESLSPLLPKFKTIDYRYLVVLVKVYDFDLLPIIRQS